MSNIDDLHFTMEDIVQDVTDQTIKYINSTPKLYKNIKNVIEANQNIKFACQGWAHEHNEEFGELFISELDMVDWAQVKKRV